MSILQKIITHKKQEILLKKKNHSLEELKDTEFFHRNTISLKENIKNKSGIIAEFKRKSPSKGNINLSADLLETVSKYEKFGASGISILTDNEFFGGSNQDIINVRNYIKTPILRKDFMIDTYQFYEAKAIGADVILLIASCLSPNEVDEFTSLAHSLGLEVLLEIHSEKEINHICPNIDFVGINNRNLNDFKVDLSHSVKLKNMIPKGIFSVAESGIYNLKDLEFLKEKGFDAFLMGEYFMKGGSI